MAAGLVKGEGFAVDASIIKADASRQRGVAGDDVDWNDPKLSSRAVREYLEALDEEALAQALPKKISLTDPQSRWTAAPGAPAFFAYSTNYLIDTEHGVIMDVEATPAHRTAEVDSTRTMVERVEAQFDLTPERLIGDTDRLATAAPAYHSCSPAYGGQAMNTIATHNHQPWNKGKLVGQKAPLRLGSPGPRKNSCRRRATFICITDESKLMPVLGCLPLPVEVIPMARAN